MRSRAGLRAIAACALLGLCAADGFGQEASELRAEARAYEHGEGVRRNVARAIELYCKAARYGDVEAQFSLGWIYANGRGVPKDDAMAAFYFRLAASQGHDHAAQMLRFVGDSVAAAPHCLTPDPPLLAAAPATPVDREAHDDEAFVPRTPMQKLAAGLVRELAPKYGVRPRLALAVIRAESNFEASARSPKNAQGLMQLIPETAARFNVARPFDPAQNIRGGLAYLRWLLAYFEGDVTLVAAAYNAGEGAVNRFRGVPPFAETRDYVQRILRLYGALEHPFDPAVTDSSPELGSIRKAASRGPRVSAAATPAREF
ncbi:MAG TPA: transglycosylase SLT domain-containing protein [Burkholderiales bacterium]|nr:transglycosylase SLT domain-containing protein [Burkholderiales bacterium]